MSAIGTGHRVTWELEPDAIVGTFACDLEPGDWCRGWCPRSECEEGCIDDAHPQKPIDHCNVLAWLGDSDGAQDLYTGEPTKPVDGPVVVEWDGDGFTWQYPAPPSSLSPVPEKETDK